MNRVKVLTLLLVLLIFCEAQRGGGGRGGGGGGGGRSSSGSSRSGSYSRSTCIANCGGKPLCIEQCHKNELPTGVMVGIIAGIFACSGGISGLAACCCCRWPRCCYFHQYKKLSRKFNTVDTASMSEQQFISKRDRLVGMLQGRQPNTQFYYNQGTQKHPIQDSHAQIISEQPFLTEIQVTGADEVGRWSAQGYILCRNGQIFLWLYKEYEDKEDAGQTGEYSHLVWESTRCGDWGIEGVWYYLGHEGSGEYSGGWGLKSQGNAQGGLY